MNVKRSLHLNTMTEVPLSKPPNPQLLPGLPGCVFMVCVFSLMCVCTLYVLNAEHKFWVWVTILCRMSLSLSNKSIRVVGSGNMCDMRDLSWIYSSKSLSAIHRLKKNCIFYWSQLKASLSNCLQTFISIHIVGRFTFITPFDPDRCRSDKLQFVTALFTLQHLVNNGHGRGYEVKLMELQVQGKQEEGLRKTHFPC